MHGCTRTGCRRRSNLHTTAKDGTTTVWQYRRCRLDYSNSHSWWRWREGSHAGSVSTTHLRRTHGESQFTLFYKKIPFLILLRHVSMAYQYWKRIQYRHGKENGVSVLQRVSLISSSFFGYSWSGRAQKDDILSKPAIYNTVSGMELSARSDRKKWEKGKKKKCQRRTSNNGLCVTLHCWT